MNHMLERNIHEKVDFDFPSNPYNICKCYFKKLYIGADSGKIIRTAHHHTFFESHFLIQGKMTYHFDREKIDLKQGSFILIPPKLKHRVDDVEKNILKYSILFTFTDPEENALFQSLSGGVPLHAPISESLLESLEYISAETEKNKELSDILISNRIFEIICALARINGFKEGKSNRKQNKEDMRLNLAKQYIEENLCYPLNCSDVSTYCHISSRQLSRIFLKNCGKSLSEYIHKKKIEEAERLVAETDLTFREISENLGFGNEYYFNTFFKKHAGMSPGEYRKVTDR